MSITIDHIILPAYNNEESARWLAKIMGLQYLGPDRHFAPVRVNDTFKLAYYTTQDFTPYHLGFHIGDEEFEGILQRLQENNISYGNDPREVTNLRTDHPFGGKGLFFLDLNGHLLEVMTVVESW
jgi:hypothetical protein